MVKKKIYLGIEQIRYQTWCFNMFITSYDIMYVINILIFFIK